MDTLDSLASLRPSSSLAFTVPNSPLAHPKWGLAWSNSHASAEALVSKALIKGSFVAVLEAVFYHGMPFVQNQWDKVCASDEAPSQRIHDYVETMLADINEGIRRAAA